MKSVCLPLLFRVVLEANAIRPKKKKKNPKYKLGKEEMVTALFKMGLST